MTSDPVPPPIRDRDPYKVAEDIHLSAFVPSDAPEMDRAHDISNSIFLGMYSESVIFPHPLEETQAYIQRLTRPAHRMRVR